MQESLFIDYIKQWFPAIVTEVVNELNGERAQRPFYHKQMLTTQYSASGKWEAVSSANSRVMADIVAMDSELPLKKRDSISKFSGDIPKSGMKMWLNEKQLTELDTLSNALGGANSDAIQRQMIRIIFADTPRVIEGIDERLEYMFLQGLSTGVTVVDGDGTDKDNVGTGIRLDFGYPTANQFGVDTVWTNVASTPFTDIEAAISAANDNGNSPRFVLVDKTTMQLIRNTNQAKQMFAWNMGMSGVALANIPAPTLEQTNAFTQSEYGFTFVIVDRKVIKEINGVRTTLTPWDTNKIILINDMNVGSLIWSFIAEMNHPVAGVAYQTANNYTLVSKYRKNEPLSEFTSSQARVVPVITNVDSIYQIDRTIVNA